jgi:hypothetical protein
MGWQQSCGIWYFYEFDFSVYLSVVNTPNGLFKKNTKTNHPDGPQDMPVNHSRWPRQTASAGPLRSFLLSLPTFKERKT